MIRRCVIAVTGMLKIIALFPCAASHRYTQSFISLCSQNGIVLSLSPRHPDWHLGVATILVILAPALLGALGCSEQL